MDMDKGSAVKEALKAVLGAISEADGRAMVGRRKPKEVSIEVEAEGGPGCEGCAKGECMDPDHMSEEDMASMEY